MFKLEPYQIWLIFIIASIITITEGICLVVLGYSGGLILRQGSVFLFVNICSGVIAQLIYSYKRSKNGR